MPTADRDGAAIWWEAEGSGEPVLLVMGLGYPGDMWYRVVARLAPEFRTIRYDNRGVGRTGVPPGPYSVATMAADALAVLDAAGEASAHVVGASMGGLIAQELALAAPDRVRSLALACTHPGLAHGVMPDQAALELVAARASMTPDEAAEASIPLVYAAGTPRSRIDEDFVVRARFPTDPVGYANQAAGSFPFDRYADLGRITIRTLVVHGAEDRLVPAGNAKILADAIPGARLELVEGASHILFTDQESRVGDLLADFLHEAP